MGDTPPGAGHTPQIGPSEATPTFRRPGRRPQRANIPLLRVVAGRDMLRFAVLIKEVPLEAGRDEECRLVLTHASVSRRHARLYWDDSGITLEDLDSTNGTTVNGEAVGRVVLRSGDLIELGSVPVRFDLVSVEELTHLRRVVGRLAAKDRDPLTGLLTRSYLQELGGLMSRADHAGVSLSFVLLDIDHFKDVNDGFGHAVGDAVLSSVARIVMLGVRRNEACVRYGGDEVLVALQGAGEKRALLAAERMRQAVEAHDWTRTAEALKVTISAGVAMREPAESMTAWIERADRALYRAKRDGRNRVCAASENEGAGGGEPGPGGPSRLQ